MKNLLFCILLFFSSCIFAQTIDELSDQKINSRPKNSSTQKNPEVNSWYADARQYIRDQEYYMQWHKELQQHVAVNRKNQLAFYFTQEGYRIASFNLPESEKDSWQYKFLFAGIQRNENKLTTTAPPVINYAAGHLTYQFPQYAIEYINDKKGMRQNFIIEKKLPGQGLLNIKIELQGDLTATQENKTGLTLSSIKNNSSKKQLHYDQLKAWDSNHKILDARMELSDDKKQLILKVDDGLAVYPITVDPMNHTPYWTDTGEGVLPSLDVLYGSSVSEAGDVNNDGYDDIIIGAPANINILSGTTVASVGQAFIYLGSATGLSATPSVTLQSSTTINALFGYAVSNAGDINNDGFDDVIVGAPADEITLNFGIPFGAITNRIGKAYLYYGNATPAAIPTSAVTISLTAGDFSPLSFGLTINPLYGFSVSTAGDVNNDGYDDVIVGSPVYTDLTTLTIAGRASVYLGSSSGLLTGSPLHRSAGLLANSLFGFSVSSAGDMNNDGADEVVIGAPGTISLLPGLTGAAYVYSGIGLPATGSLAAVPATYSNGSLLKTLFGFSVSNAGDVNNDGFDDIVIGEPGSLSLSSLVTVGKASIFLGSATLANKTTNDIALRSPRDPDLLGLLGGNLLFGFSVSGGKDFNCDGIADIVIGEPGGTALSGLGGVNAVGGQAYIYFGKNGSGPPAERGWEWKQTGSIIVANLLGSSVSPAGDVNGDGKDELLVGASNGTLNLTNVVTGLLNFVLLQSVGSAYVADGCIGPDLFALPVRLIYFKGIAQENQAVLNWQTTSEINCSHFEIERSSDGVAFEKIGAVSAKGDMIADPLYMFIDTHPSAVLNTYRLKITDKDGSFTYSPVIIIKSGNRAVITLRTTLVSSFIEIVFTNPPKGIYKIDLLSMNGQLMQSGRVPLTGSGVMQVGLKDGLSKGIYIVNMQHEAGLFQYRQKIMIQ